MTALPARTGVSDTYPKPTNKQAKEALGQMWDVLSEISEKPEVEIASAVTCDIGGQSSTKIRITGSATITSFGVNYRGPILLRMAGALTITHNSSTLICPGATDLVTKAGDMLLVSPKATSGVSDGWHIVRSDSESSLPFLSIKSCGAAGDGITDDTVAFQAALDSDSQCIYIPPGIYELSDQLTHSGKPLTILGAGSNNTILRWSNALPAARGLNITQVLDSDFIELRGFSLLTATSGTSGTAITITGGSVNSGWIRSNISDVCMRGTEAVNLAGWNGGIDLTDMSQVVIRDCSFMGRYQGAFTSKLSEFFVRARKSSAGVAHVQILNNMVLHTNKAIDSDNIEGVYCHQNNFVVVNYGVYLTNSEGMKPQLQFTDNHVNAHITCIHVEDLSQSEISQNNLYMRTDVGSPIGIYGNNLYMSSMIGNKFVTVGTDYTATGISLLGATSTNNVIDDNVFQSATTALNLGSGTNLNVIGFGNSYGVVTNLLTDTGTNNYKFQLRHNRLEYQGTQVLTGRQTGWGATMTGAADKSTVRDVATVTTAQLAARFKALEDALRTHGLIGS